MDTHYKKITKDEIPDDVNFEGYYWYSDSKVPEPIYDKKINIAKFKALPFVIEGNFYSESMNISIQVKNIDGNYHFAKIDLNIAESEAIVLDNVEYIAHDLKGVKKYKMVEAWEEEADELIENMKVLTPTWTAFAGFIK